jgi:plasmid stability protein
MTHLQIKNVPSELHEQLRERAESEGLTMSQYVIELLQADLACPGPREWLRVVLNRAPSGVSRDDVLEAIGTGRSEREEELASASDRD